MRLLPGARLCALQVSLRSDLVDPHVYCLSAWVLDLLAAAAAAAAKPRKASKKAAGGGCGEAGGRFVSLRHDLVPFLVKRQLRAGSSVGKEAGKLLPKVASRGQTMERKGKGGGGINSIKLDQLRRVPFRQEQGSAFWLSFDRSSWFLSPPMISHTLPQCRSNACACVHVCVCAL